MLETRRPGKEVLAAMAAKEIYIGRIWPAWPTQVRITVGTPRRDDGFPHGIQGSDEFATPQAWSRRPLPREFAEHPLPTSVVAQIDSPEQRSCQIRQDFPFARSTPPHRSFRIEAPSSKEYPSAHIKADGF